MTLTLVDELTKFEEPLIRMTHRPKFSARVEDDWGSDVQIGSITLPGVTKNMVFVVKHHSIDSLMCVVGVACVEDGTLDIRLVSSSVQRSFVDFTVIAL